MAYTVLGIQTAAASAWCARMRPVRAGRGPRAVLHQRAVVTLGVERRDEGERGRRVATMPELQRSSHLVAVT